MADAARYHRLQLLLALLGLGISLAYLLAALLTGAGHAVAYWAARVTSARWGQIALVALLLGAGHGALGFPVTLRRSYWLQRRFGLLHEAFGGWLADRLKAMLIGGALGLAAVELVYALLELTPLWWLVAASVFFAARIALTAVLPVWIVPLFYRLVPLADDGLRERLLALARRAGVDAIGVFVADQSKKSRTANAAVVGLGRTRRIILFDTLLADFPPEEIESVLAHELGHHVHGDIRRGLLLQGVLTLVSFWLAALGLDAGDRSATLGLARTRLEQDRAAEAETLARRAAAVVPSAETDLLIAEALFAQGRVADVVATCRAAADAGREDDLVAWWAGRA